ncbi:hypothetical protein DACRYDRAFT_108466 [Dacryopinax primogenitus]|uniref:F-box domain-containing protein n=1 Tax=Dacryopinax primogenitus (strain DJM 731) TaxID=1858805 RepID=M5G5R3_DACPD|nr:uncharacterized protein DACRYDRAFT_108466 [Dacryopinax primogenitus]EJU01137.1 hypothetical protein DACRYDRAFT_108466 [Dacryopinax primogenitus]
MTPTQITRRALQAHAAPLGEEATRLGLRHLLDIDLGDNRQIIPRALPIWERPAPLLKQSIPTRVKEILRADRKSASIPPIDGLPFHKFFMHDEWIKALAEVLDGIRPRLLELAAGCHEYCSLDEFDMFRTPFPLETLIISGAIELETSIQSTLLPRITTLYLNYCSGLRFPTLPSPLKLRRLIMVENNVMDMICWMAEETHMLEELEELVLTGTNGCDLASCFDWQQYLDSFQKMPRLRMLQLSHRILSYFEEATLNGLPVVLPQTHLGPA